jgi:hypothetical protein
MFKATMSTLKRLASAIGLAFDGVYMVTPRTSLAGIGRWNQDNAYSSNVCLVLGKYSQLVKSPIIGSASFRLAAWLLVKMKNKDAVYTSVVDYF